MRPAASSRSTALLLERMIPSMPSARVRKLLAEAAELPIEERQELVDELARTLPDAAPANDELEELDVDYDALDRRMASVRDGSAVLVPWEDARKQLRNG